MRNFKNKIIFLVMYLAYTAIYLARVNLSMAAPELMNLKICDAVQIGFLGSAFSTVYSVGRLINGGISDTAPPWKMIVTGLIASGIANILVGFFPPYIGIFLMWSVNAYAQSMLWSSVLCVITSVYDSAEAKKKMSVMITAVATGNILGIAVNAFFITQFGVRFAFIIPGAVTVFLGAVVFFTVRDIKGGEKKEKKPLFEALKNRELLLMCIPSAFHGVMKENISLWIAVFVADKYAVNLKTSAYYILLIPVIGFIGRALYPFVFGLCKEKENRVSFIFFGICLVFSALLCAGNAGMLVSVIALGAIYASASVINTSFLSVYPLKFLKNGNSASVSGIMDFAAYLGAGVSSAVYGAVIRNFGYFPMFLSWVVISAISMIIIKFWGEREVV